MAAVKTSVKKRTLIARANKNMFIWVAIVSAVLGIVVVASIILVQRIAHMNRVIDAKSTTLSNLKSNNSAIPDLQNNIRALNSNQALIDSKAKSTDEAVQVVLDALPSEANSLALGASFQSVLLAGISGVTVDSITVDPVFGVESLGEGTVVSTTSESGVPTISFRFSVRGDLLKLIEVLNRLEKSIRVIDTKKVKIESQGNKQILTVEGVAYYQPTVVVNQTQKVIK